MPVTEAVRYAQKQQRGSVRMQLAVSALADLEANLQQHITRMRLGGLPLERSFLMDCSRRIIPSRTAARKSYRSRFHCNWPFSPLT